MRDITIWPRAIAALAVCIAITLLAIAAPALAVVPVSSTNYGTSATTPDGMLVAGEDGSVSGTLNVTQDYSACTGSSSCQWNLEAIGISASDTADPTCPRSTLVQGWQSQTYTASGSFQIPLSIQPPQTGPGAICVYVNMTTGAGTFQGLVNSFPYVLPAFAGTASLTVVPEGTTVGGNLTLTQSGCTSSLCAWSSELELVSGTSCPAASTVTALDPHSGWQYQSAPGDAAATVTLSWSYAGELPRYTKAGTLMACVYIGPIGGTATSLLGETEYAYIAPLSSQTARVAVSAALKRKLHTIPVLSCRQRNSSTAVCTVRASRGHYSWRGTVAVSEPMWAAKLTISAKLTRKRF